MISLVEHSSKSTLVLSRTSQLGTELSPELSPAYISYSLAMKYSVTVINVSPSVKLLAEIEKCVVV